MVAAGLAANVKKQSEGTDRMKEIAAAIHEGARAILFAEYKILAIIIVIVFVAVGFAIGWTTALCFLIGAFFSIIAGFCGMTVATRANVRTANAAKEKGMAAALSVAFRGGAVMGLCVVGLGLFGVSIIYVLTGNSSILFGFSLGASFVALFARVGGGIYTKAADVGADLVGKVEAGIPEDDPRNPAVIAEGNMAGIAAGLATCGKVPFMSSFAMFAAGRAFEQVRNSIGYPHLNVKIGATHAGISVGEDGATHQCNEDISLMRMIPGMVVINPCDDVEAKAAVRAAYEYEGPVYLRFGRLAVPVINDEATYKFELGKGVVLKEGKFFSHIQCI